MARLVAINRRLLSQSNQRLDFTSGPDSDFEDAEDFRLKLDLSEMTLKGKELRHRTRSSSGGSGILGHRASVSVDGASDRKGSDGGASPPQDGRTSPLLRKTSVHRRTSQSMEDAFLEQLPVVKPKTSHCNGSASSDEGT